MKSNKTNDEHVSGKKSGVKPPFGRASG